MHGVGVQRRVLVGTTAVAVLVVSLLVVRLSSAAFVAQTRNEGNSWATGVVELTHDAGGAAMFAVAGMLPGDVVENCIQVIYTGTGNAGVHFWGEDLSDTDDLADDLLLAVEVGEGGGFGSCDEFEADATLVGDDPTCDPSLGCTLSGAASWLTPALASTAPNWVAGPGDLSRTYRITVALDAGSDKSGAEAFYTFVWHAQGASLGG